MNRKKKDEKKEAAKRASTREFIGAKEITDYSLVTYGQGELVYFIVQPTNVAVLSAESIRVRIYALMTVLKGVAEIEMLCLNSRESFEDNKQFLRSRIFYSWLFRLHGCLYRIWAGISGLLYWKLIWR